MPIPESLAKRFCVVENTDGVIEFDGRYDECLSYMRQHLRRAQSGLIDLRFATKSEHGLLELGCFASFVL